MKRAVFFVLAFVIAVGAILSLQALRKPIASHPDSGVIPEESAVKVGTEIGNLAPDFALETPDGKMLRLSELRGRKAIINFWATWCAPCKLEMPDFERVHQRYADRLTLLGINLQEEPEAIKKFLRDDVHVSYPILLDRTGDVVRAYRVIAQPATYWLDEQGRIVQQKYGAYITEELEQRVHEFLVLGQSISPVNTIDGGLKRGDLSHKYFSQHDLESLGIEGDPSQVAYLSDLDLNQLDLGCPARDCIPSIDGPQFETSVEANSWLKPSDLVVSVTHNNITKAYPVKILNWHEIVNDDFNGVFLAITYCPLCNSSLVFRKPIVDGRPLQFRVSGRLYKSDLVMYDRQTASFWSQIEGRAIIGPLAGQRLEYVPTEMMTWQKWQALHPVAWVLARPTFQTAVGGQPPQPKPEAPATSRGRPGGPQIIDPSTGATLDQNFLRDYNTDPYSWYKTDDANTFGTPFDDERLSAKTTIWGLELNNAAKAYLPEAVARFGALNDEVGGQPVLVWWESERAIVKFFDRRLEGHTRTFIRRDGQLIDTETQSIWNAEGRAESGPLDGRQLRQLPGIPAFWFAWLAFHPKTKLYK